MGGKGTGAWQAATAKMLVEQCLCLDVRKLRKIIGPDWCSRGEIQIGTCSMGYELQGDVLTLSYVFPDGRTAQSIIHIVSTVPHFGGAVYWFACPSCKRRCERLYLAPGRLTFCCRKCGRLNYASTRRTDTDEEARHARLDRKIEEFAAWADALLKKYDR